MLKINTRSLSWGHGLLLVCCLVAGSHIATRGSDAPAKAAEAAPLPQVGVITLAQQEIRRTTELPGRTTAVMTSEVRPQVSGVIQKRFFKEGGEVNAGEQLYQIEPATYQAAYDSAKAALARNQATLETARAKEVRYRKLIGEHVISQQEYDDVAAAAKQSQADIASAQASLEQARINLEYTKVLSPITGRIGHAKVTPGALVTANQDTPLATVTSLDPIYVDLNQSVPTLLRLKKELENGELVQNDESAAQVTLKLEDGSIYQLPGRLQFTEVIVDQGTGTVLLRAIFPNPQHTILPGMYVHAVIQEGVNKNGLAVPQKAVGRNSQGESTVMVVNEENTVGLRTIETGPALGDKWIVTEGLRPGERVLVDGRHNVRPGAVVEPVAVDMPAATGTASAATTKNS